MNSTLVIHFTHLRTYHLARLHAAEQACGGMFSRIQGIALYDHTGDIPPDAEIARPACPPEVLLPGVYGGNPRRAIRKALGRLRPSAIAICGYATPDARECLRWARRHGALTILMTETRQADGHRHWWKEWIKSRLVRRFDGALCGGPAARAYLEKLGMPANRIQEGYDLVDNGYFRKGRDAFTHASDFSPTARDANESACGGPPTADEVGRMRKSDPSPFFLASNRFIGRKNLFRLIEAYAMYGRDRFTHRSEEPGSAGPAAPDQVGRLRKDDPTRAIWHLCLLGDGELKPALIAKCHELGLTVIESAPWEYHSPITNNQSPITHPNRAAVWMPGWRSHAELPRFYAQAGCFIHPATSEPWGLVINEAMACGLPILTSHNAGAAEVLVDDGVNGWKFDPTDVDALARHMATISAFRFPLPAFGASSRRILDERCPTRAFGEGLARVLHTLQASKGIRSLFHALRRIFLALIVILFVSASAGMAWIWWGDWPNPAATGEMRDPALVMVLGGGDGTRFQVAARMATKYPDVPLLITGDSGHILRSLLTLGIPESRILIEPEATSTWENALFSKPWVAAAGDGELVIVTNDLHGPRALACFRKHFPGRRLVLACETTSQPFLPWQNEFRRRERAAALYYLIRYRVWSW